MANDFDQRRLDTFVQRLRLMRRPFELAVAFARRGEDRDFADRAAESRLETEIIIHRPRIFRILR